MRCVIFILCLLVSYSAASQSRRGKRKISNDKGTIFASLGYNRSVYTKTKTHFEGSGYNFDFTQAKARDNQSKLGSGDYLAFTCQYNVKAGYYFKDLSAISISWDHMKYFFSNENHVYFTGFVTMDPTATIDFGDGQAFPTGYHANIPVSTYDDDFSYQTTKGLNYIHADLNHTIKLFGSGKRDRVVLSSNMSVGAGLLYTSIDYNYAGKKTVNKTSMSGYGLSASIGLRLEFYKRAYLYSSFSPGIMHQLHVKTRPDDLTAYSSQFFGFSQAEMGIGVLLYKRTKNGCDDCPVW